METLPNLAVALGIIVSIVNACFIHIDDLMGQLAPHLLAPHLLWKRLTLQLVSFPEAFPLLMIDPRLMNLSTFLTHGCDSRNRNFRM